MPALSGVFCWAVKVNTLPNQLLASVKFKLRRFKPATGATVVLSNVVVNAAALWMPTSVATEIVLVLLPRAASNAVVCA